MEIYIDGVGIIKVPYRQRLEIALSFIEEFEDVIELFTQVGPEYVGQTLKGLRKLSQEKDR